MAEVASAAQLLAGAAFQGHLKPPGMGKCALSYRFADAPKDPPLPAGVKAQRRQLGWGCKDQEICCFSASCSVPDLGLEAEDVVISVDPAGPDGSRRMLLQSLKRPDLGVTLLQLEPCGSKIVGGDDSWSPGETPLIRAKRCERAADIADKAPASPDRSPATASDGSPASVAAPRAPAPPSTPSSGARRPVVREREPRARAAAPGAEPDAEPAPGASQEEALLGFGVLGGSDGAREEDVEWRMPLPIGGEGGRLEDAFEDSTAPRVAVAGGIGRSIGRSGGSASRAASKTSPAGGGYQADEESRALRPDMATGEPGSSQQEKSLGPNVLDEEIKAAAAANQERLVSAAAAGETGDVRQHLMRRGVAADSGAPQGSFAGLTALMAAAQRGRMEAVELLMEKKASLDVRDPSGWTALMHAVHGQRAEVVKTLLAAGAEFQQGAEADGGTTPLILAAAGPRHELCKVLLSKKAKTETRDSEGCRALHHAARRGHGGAVVALLSARAQLEGKDSEGRTPLLAAVSSGRAECVQLLLSNRADIQAVDLEERGAKQLAKAYEHDRVLKVLEERS